VSKRRGFPELGLFGAIVLLAAPALAGDPPAEHLWSHVHNGETWTGYEVSIGYHGSRVFSDTGWFTRKTRVYSTWETPDMDTLPEMFVEVSSSLDSDGRAVDSAEKIDLHVVCRLQESATGNEIHVEAFESSQPDFLWNFVFPETVGGGDIFCEVTPDGRWIVAGASVGADLHYVVFDTWSSHPSVPVRDFQQTLSGGGVCVFEISDDGARLYAASPLYGKVYDLNTGTELFDEILWGASPFGFSFAGDGMTLVYSKDGIYNVYRDQGSGYSEIGSFGHECGGSHTGASYSALSSDGTVLIGTGSSDSLTAHVVAWNVNSGAMLLEDTISGGGSLQNVPSCVALSDADDRIAVGFWGDEAGLAPEVMVYERETSGGTFDSLCSFNLPGSVKEIDISADGKTLVTSGKNDHMNVGSGKKVIDVFDLGSDLRVRGVPHTGQDVLFEYYLDPHSGAVAFLLESTALANPPETFSVGTLYVGRGSIVSVRRMTVNGGTATQTHRVEYAPGVTRYFQTFSSAPEATRKLSEDWVLLTAVP
jgi:WD40 repeat protein